jgi:NitT/TauT family transport system substrate-binding protein
VKFFLLAADGYPPYGSTMVTTRGFIAKNPDAIGAFVKASLEGWKDYMTNPAPANVLIKRDDPKMTDDRITFAIETMKALKVLNGDAAATQGIGVMTEARWNKTFDFLVKANLIKPTTKWQNAFTLDYVKDLHIMMA